MEVEELILAAALTIEPVLWASSVVGHSMVGLVFWCLVRRRRRRATETDDDDDAVSSRHLWSPRFWRAMEIMAGSSEIIRHPVLVETDKQRDNMESLTCFASKNYCGW